ncbi:glycosyltransferase family 4 protein [Crocosphaera sp.]|uniref:glycosyltransferase family 4 protein n=1 Tax=Crocosphaera sp. TaxID=2729996 RepID=UPI003F253A7B|nr:glycosyltransferase family 4 protein [Crocosphaera sp.]
MTIHLLMVVENASTQMGGESSKNIQLFRRLRQKGLDVWMICHARCRDELKELFPEEEALSRILFIEDSWIQKLLWRIGQLLPYRVEDLVVGQLIHIITQIRERQLAKRLIAEQNIQLVFQPTPLSAKAVSFMYNLNVPVVIGPLCGDLEFPPDFRSMDSWIERLTVNLGRRSSLLLHKLFPGKVNAETLIYSDQSALNALPPGYRGRLVKMLEPAVDTSLWQHRQYRQPQAGEPVRCVYLGRLVDWKGVQYLVEAFLSVVKQTNAVLEIVGDGELRGQLEEAAKNYGIEQHVHFHGWQSHDRCVELLNQSDIFIMPSLRESGGHAVLEAMALGLPVVVTRWGGPAQTVSPDCGILVDPDSPGAFVQGLAEAIIHLANSPELRESMARIGPLQVKRQGLDWDDKCDRFIEIFEETLAPQSQKCPLERSRVNILEPKIS